MSVFDRRSLVLVFALSACGGLPETSTVLEVCEGELDPVDIGQATMMADVLQLEVSYGGGCETHEFRLCWNEKFRESQPVQVALTLQHDANGDTCEAYLHEELEFDLAPLKAAYMSAYGREHGAIQLVVGEGVLYEF